MKILLTTLASGGIFFGGLHGFAQTSTGNNTTVPSQTGSQSTVPSSSLTSGSATGINPNTNNTATQYPNPNLSGSPATDTMGSTATAPMPSYGTTSR